MIIFFYFGNNKCGDIMKKVNFRSDLAIESLSEAIENKDYKHSEEVEGNIKIEKEMFI